MGGVLVEPSADISSDGFVIECLQREQPDSDETKGWPNRQNDILLGRTSSCVSLWSPSHRNKMQVCRYRTSPGTVGRGD